MKINLKPNYNFILASLVFVMVMAVYLFTLAPTVTTEDSAEFVTAAYTLGVAHPPGFPLYVLLGKLFTLIPLGSIAWRVNLMSAVFGAMTIALTYLIMEKIVKNRLIAFCFPFVLAFSPIFWSQSVIAEVYTLNTFFVALLILILLIWAEKKKNSYLLWFSFLYGLSITNHTMMVLLAPAFTLYILFVDKTIIKKWQLIIRMFYLFVLGFAVYFYLPLRAAQLPPLNWGPISTMRDVLAHITRSQYNDFSPFANQYGKTGIVISFLFEIYQQFFLPTLLLALGGAIYLWRKKRSVAILTIAIFLLNSLGIIYLRKFGWGRGIDYTYRVYYLPAFLIVTVWLAAIASYLYDFLAGVFKNKQATLFKIVKLVFFLVIISLPVSFLSANYQSSDQSDFWLNYDYTKNLLDSLEKDSIYYLAYDGSLQGDTEIFNLIYLKMVENYRPDVDIICEQNFFYKSVFIQLPKEYFDLAFEERREKFFELLNNVKDRPIYTNFVAVPKENSLGWFSLSNGYANKIYPNLAEATKAKLPGYFSALRNLDEVSELDDPATAGIAAHYYYNLAAFYLNQNQRTKSQYYLIKAFNLDSAPFNHEYSRFMIYRSDWSDRLLN